MKTSLYTEERLAEVVALLAQNELVAFPTETVFGLGANVYSDYACQKVYDTKKRPIKNPLIVHIATLNDLKTVTDEYLQWAYDLFEYFSPGPLTIVLQKASCISSIATAGLATVAVRIPAHPVAQNLLKACPFPLVAPSANQSGRPSPTCTEMVMNEMQGLIPAILDGESSYYGIESTIIGEIDKNIVILRPGSLTPEDLAYVLGSTPPLYQGSPSKIHNLKNPGSYYPHYQPHYPVNLIEASKIPQFCGSHCNDHCGLFILEDSLKYLAGLNLSWKIKIFTDIHDYTRQLYKSLTVFESQKISKLFAEIPKKTGLGLALFNRLYHAASKNWD